MNTQEKIKTIVTTHPVVLFMKGTRQVSTVRFFFPRRANSSGSRFERFFYCQCA